MKKFLRRLVNGPDKKKVTPSKFMKDNPLYAKYSIGTMTYGFPKVYDYNDGTDLEIGSFCSFADNVNILIGGEHHSDFVSTFPFTTFFKGDYQIRDKKSKGGVKIGNDVWVANNVTILSGITIGDGAVLGAGSVVTKDVKDYEIVGGNPAKHLKYRFTDEQISNMKAVAWWDWDMDKIKANYSLIMSNNIDLFIEKHRV
ncbi:CatB-related O-acetyltransferase [Winogradskyella sp. A2]|uniref:CatB-related O-acetyltransferase n=1 Tax=Winogradskyella sp. A2 TaxID=3366944 RepID=UPI00398C62EC